MGFLSDLERLDAAVAKGPVVARHGDAYADVVAGPQRVAYVWSKPERELYVLLRNACPALVALVRAAEAVNISDEENNGEAFTNALLSLRKASAALSALGGAE